jgi:hypothetical protein
MDDTEVAHDSWIRRCLETAENYISMRCEKCGPFQAETAPHLDVWFTCTSIQERRVTPVSPVNPLLAGMLLSTTTPEHPIIQRGTALSAYLGWLDEVFGEHQITTSPGWVYYSVGSPNLSCLSKIAWSNPDYRDFWHVHCLVVPVNDFELGALLWQRK